jgi:hypothetical protein
MKTYVAKGIIGEDTVYVLETLEDWDEYEKILNDIQTMKPYDDLFPENHLHMLITNEIY